jgi:hypothetical protein
MLHIIMVVVASLLTHRFRFLDGNMVSAKKSGVEKILSELLERFSDGDPMFQYRGQMLLKEIADWEPDV